MSSKSSAGNPRVLWLHKLPSSHWLGQQATQEDGSKASRPWRHLPGRTARRWEEEGTHSPLIAIKSRDECLDATCVSAFVSSSASDSSQLPTQNYVTAEICEEHGFLLWLGCVASETQHGTANCLWVKTLQIA